LVLLGDGGSRRDLDPEELEFPGVDAAEVEMQSEAFLVLGPEA